ncbi:hypothetical protein B566_EDAN003801 [Ephemera danica]|nr:hypothetical protein B566_EDAN003801 [Ephemera danica]
MTPCSHNFCSLCIRKYMQYKTSCPACLVETLETQLKNNRVLDELVKILERLKPPLCKALTGSGHELGLPTSNEQPKVTPESTYSDQPKVTLESTYCEKPKVTQNSTVIEEPKFIQIEDSNFRQNSPKIQPKPIESTKSIFTSLETNSSVTTTHESSPNSKLSEALKILENNVPSHSTLTLDKNKQFSAKLPGGQEQRIPSMGRISPEVVTLAVVDKPQAFPSSSSLPASPQKPIKRTIADMFKKSPMKKSGLSNQLTQNPVSPVKSYLNTVSCPVCSVNIPNININQHLDACLKNEKVPPKPSTKVMKSRQPLPKLVYRLLKEKDLKMKLADQKLNTQGDRKTLEKRYQRYVGYKIKNNYN